MPKRRLLPRRTSDARLKPQLERLELRQMLAADTHIEDLAPPVSWFQRIDHESAQVAAIAAGAPMDEWFAQFVGPRRFERHDWIIQLTPDAIRKLNALSDLPSKLNQSEIEFRVHAGLGLPGLLRVESLSNSRDMVVESLGVNDWVASFSSNDRVGGLVLPNDSDFGSMTGLHNVGQFGASNDADIDAPEAWDVSKGSASVVVGIVDSGVDATHPDLYLNMWLNQGEIPEAKRNALVDTDADGRITFYDLNQLANAAQVRDLNGTGYIDAIDLLEDALWADGRDTDGNGFTDDFFGWNFRNDSNEIFAPNNPSDVLGHGTHVAGTIGAIGNNARGVTGINWRSSIMALKFLDENNQGDTASAMAAINYARMMRTQFGTNVRVLNNSWGQPGGANPLLRNTIDAGGEAGILFVAAAGNGNILGQGVDNDRTPFYPASYESNSVIAVGASDGGDRLASFSNFGVRSVDIVAPGVGVRSTLPGGKYGEANGTSMATPHVAGTAALIWSLQPDASVDEIRRALLEQGDAIPALGGFVGTGRRLNAFKSLGADVFAPTAQLLSAPNIIVAGSTEQWIEVKYKNRLGVDTTSLGNSDLTIVRQAALDETLSATFVSFTPNSDQTEVTARYRLNAVGGIWDAEDYGNYVITARADAARSMSGLSSRETTLGSFRVKIEAPGIFYVDTYLDTVDANIGDGQAKDGAGRTSLRAALQEANALRPQPVKIFLQSGVHPLSIAPVIDAAVNYPVPPPGSGYDAPSDLKWSNGSTGDLDLQGNISMVGLGASRTTIDAKGMDRVMKIYPGATVEIIGMTLTGGKAPTNHSGGAILNSGALSLDLVTIEDNEAMGGPASLGGGIAHWSNHVSISRSTLENNRAIGGGGMFVTNGATATVDSTTFVGNIADGSSMPGAKPFGGGGLLSKSGGAIAIENSTYSNNLATGDALGDAIRSSNDVGDGDLFPAQISGDGKYVMLAAFYRLTETAATPFRNIFLFNRETGEYELVSKASDGSHANGESIMLTTSSISSDGRYVVYRSDASNLVPDDNNNATDIFIYDRVERTTKRVNLSRNGEEPNEVSNIPGLSGDGRYVFFNSFADNLVEGDTNGTTDIFRYDVSTGQTQIVSLTWNGESIPGDHSYGIPDRVGRFVTFQSDAKGLSQNDNDAFYDVFVKDMVTGNVELISRGPGGTSANSHSSLPTISSDGRFVAYHSMASNLVEGDTNNIIDVFIYDRETQQTRLVSRGYDGSPANALSQYAEVSENGRYVVFNSDASNLVPGDTNGLSDYFWVDLEENRVLKIPFDGPLNTFAKATMSGDGRYVSFTRDINLHAGVGDDDGLRDSFIFDTTTGILSQESPTQGVNGSWLQQRFVSGNNRYVAYSDWMFDDQRAYLSWYPEIRLLDLASNTSINVTRANDQVPDNSSTNPVVDDQGRFVVYSSLASNLVTGDDNNATDLFLFDTVTKLTKRIATADPSNTTLIPQNQQLSANGKTVVFESAASHLVPGDTNNAMDVFAYDIESGTLKMLSRAQDGTSANGVSRVPMISGDGNFVTFVSAATNLVTGDTNAQMDLFLHDLATGTNQVLSRPFGSSTGGGGMRVARGISSLNYDASKIVFESTASDLVHGDTNGKRDVFVYERATGLLTRVSVGNFGEQGDADSRVPAISPDGRYIGFLTLATNIVTSGDAPDNRYIVYDTYAQTKRAITATSPELYSAQFAMDSALSIPRFTGPTSLSLTSSRSLVNVDLEQRSLVAYTHENVPRPNRVTINHSTIFSEGMPDKSIGLELIDGDMTVTNSIVSRLSKERIVVPNAYNNMETPTYFNTVFLRTDELSPLGDYGGHVKTHKINETSPAFQSAGVWNSLAKDQRGTEREGVRDAGAFEVVGATVSGRVYQDMNGNGVFDADETGMASVRVCVDANRDGTYTEGELCATTAADDLSTISRNEAGLYELREVTPSFSPVIVLDGAVISNPSRGVDNLPTDQAIPSWAISGDGQRVVFASDESDLVPNDSNGLRDVFLWDRSQGTVTRVSVSTDQGQSNGASDHVAISSDGSVIAFQSNATNLVAGDANGKRDTFIYRVQTGSVERVSVDALGGQSDGESLTQVLIDATGRRVAFASTATNLVPEPHNGRSNIFVKDIATGVIDRLDEIPEATRIDTLDNKEVLNASFNGDFTKVAFVSANSNVVAGDTNGHADVFFLDRVSNTTKRINLGINGEQANWLSDHAVISGNGARIAYTSRATNLYAADRSWLPEVYVYDIASESTEVIIAPSDFDRQVGQPSISENGEQVGARIFTGSRGLYRAYNVDNDGYVDTVSIKTTNASVYKQIVGLVSGDGKHVLASNGTASSLWESELSSGPVLRLGDAETVELDFPIRVQPGTISGRVFQDRIQNGLLDQSENVLSGIQVVLDANLNGQFDLGEKTRSTDAAGFFEFAGIDAEREYSVLAIPSSEWSQVSPTDGAAWRVFVPSGATISDRDFGFVPASTGGQFENATLSGKIFNDLNGDGIIQAGEMGLSGITVFLDLNANEARDFNEPRTVTDSNGFYSFAGLGNRAYTVRTILPVGTVQTSPLGSKFTTIPYTLTTGSTQLANPQDVLNDDLNGDGWSDLAIALFSGNAIAIRLNDQQGGFGGAPISIPIAPEGLGPIALANGKLNPGNAVDLISANQLNGTATILLDFNGTSFASKQTVAVGDTPTDVILGRFDADADIDAIVANKGTDQLTMLINNGNGVFTKGVSFPSGGKQPTAIVSGFFNNDSFLDLAVANYGNHPAGGDLGNLAIHMGRGDGTYLAPVSYSVGFGPISLAVSDVNGDGVSDLVTANFLANTASVLIGNSDGTFAVATEQLATGQGPLQVQLQDVEGDGDKDILVTNLLSQTISVLRNRKSQGGTGFEPAENFGVAEFSTAPRLAFAAGDFDQSGTADIAIINSLSDSLKIMRNTLVNGAHRIQLTGIENVSNLHFGTRPDVLIPKLDPIDNPESILEDAPQQSIALRGIALGRAGGPALRISASSSQPSVVPHPSVHYVPGASTGQVTFTPVSNANGIATITVTARDAGADALFDTADDGVLSRMFTVTVKPVNDAPTFTMPRSLSVSEDSAAQSITGFLTGIGPGPLESFQTLSDFTVSVDKPDLFSVAPTIDRSGTLRFTPRANAVGAAIITVSLSDNGDVAYGGVSTRVDQFLILVDGVNDAPSITIGGNQTIQVGAASQSVASFASGFLPGGGADEATQRIEGFVVSVDRPELFAVLPTISTSGVLTYTPSATRTGTAKVQVQVRDSGGSANGGIDLSATKTFDIVVSPLPDSTPPIPVLSSTVANPTNQSTFDLDIDFGEPVTGFTLSDFSLSQATIANLTDLGLGKYTVRLTATTNGTISASIPANSVKDNANNANLASGVFSRVVDTIAPTVAISTTEVNPTTRRSFPINIQFSETVSGFDPSDLVLGNATMSDWVDVGSGRFTATLNAVTDGAVLVGFSGGVARDAAGNGNTSPTPLIHSVNTGAARYKPILTTTEASPTPNRVWTATIDFGRAVTGFTADDLALSNGTATITEIGSGRYRLQVTSTTSGNVSVSLPAGKVLDGSNQPNDASDPVMVRFVDTTDSDLGDAPTPYPTRIVDNGPFHKRTALFLGAGSDAEIDGSPNSTAQGDDATGSDDEDGILFPLTLIVSSTGATTSTYIATVSASGFLDGWLDLNGDGDWEDTGEQIAIKAAVTAGRNILPLTIPSSAVAGTSYARFRLSSIGGLGTTGSALDGEVEDYAVQLVGGASKDFVVLASQLGPHQISVVGNRIQIGHQGTMYADVPNAEIARLQGIESGGKVRFDWSGISSGLPGTVRYTGPTDSVVLEATTGSIDITSYGASRLSGIESTDLRASGRNVLYVTPNDVRTLNASKRLRVFLDTQDQLVTPSTWQAKPGRVEGGVWVQPYAQSDATLEVISARPWRNEVQKFDIDGDQSVSPLDVLLLINAINSNLFVGGVLPARSASTPAGFFDPDGDGSLSPLDPLIVVNQLNSGGNSGGEGEGEGGREAASARRHSTSEAVSKSIRGGLQIQLVPSDRRREHIDLLMMADVSELFERKKR